MGAHTRRDVLQMALAGIGGGVMSSALGGIASAQAGQRPDGPNVLFIPVDDLRPQMGCYGQEQIVSPNLDRLAATGTVFRRAHCQQAVCAPSRASVLSGCRPDTTTIYDLRTPLRTVMPDVVTLPQHFKDNGYTSISLGKIYHHGKREDPPGWSEDPWLPQTPFPGCVTPENLALLARLKAASDDPSRVRGAPYEAGDLPDNAYPDGAITDRAIETLRRLKDEPFFLAAGLLKPHLAFACPKRYWDLYDRDSIDLADNPMKPQDCPDIAMHSWGELRQYHDIPAKGPLDDDLARTLIHGYYACVSFIDAQVGRLLDALEELDLDDNTIVVLWGDHGWNLGEHGLWCKHCNFETSTHSPMLVRAPGQKIIGAGSDALTEFVDMYPSLCELAGLPVPEHLEGTSFVPLLDDPGQEWKTAAFSQYPRGRVMGYSMRTDRYRYTEWTHPDDGVIARELYDHREDPGENVSLAERPEHRELVQRLSEKLAAGWQAARP